MLPASTVSNTFLFGSFLGASTVFKTFLFGCFLEAFTVSNTFGTFSDGFPNSSSNTYNLKNGQKEVRFGIRTSLSRKFSQEKPFVSHRIVETEKFTIVRVPALIFSTLVISLPTNRTQAMGP